MSSYYFTNKFRPTPLYVSFFKSKFQNNMRFIKIIDKFLPLKKFKTYINAIEMLFSKLVKLLIDCINISKNFSQKKTFYELFNYLF